MEALGKKLFFETRLSADGTVSCATCHDVTRGFTDQRPTSEGIKGQLGRRNAPNTMNAVLLGGASMLIGASAVHFVDARESEEQARVTPPPPTSEPA